MQALSRPQAVVLEEKCRKNIGTLVKKAQSFGAEFRPHFKTHQSVEIGRWFREAGVTGITVSTPEMAAYFINDGWNDITLGFPFFPAQIHQIKKLSPKCHFRLFVHREEDIEELTRHIDSPVSAMIEIDTGYNRSGIPAENSEKIHSLIEKIRESDSIHFHGFYIHDGDTYKAHGKEEVSQVIERNLKAFKNLKSTYPEAKLCLGDTPSSSLLNDLHDIDELSPGNLIFFDLMQITIGSCGYNDVGMLVKVPVAQQKSHNDQCIIHGGAVHFSKDRISIDGQITFGQPVTLSENGIIKKIDGSSLIALSQEHGTITGLNALKKAYNVDQLTEVWVCPVHSCLTANLFKEYHTLSETVIKKKVLS